MCSETSERILKNKFSSQNLSNRNIYNLEKIIFFSKAKTITMNWVQEEQVKQAITALCCIFIYFVGFFPKSFHVLNCWKITIRFWFSNISVPESIMSETIKYGYKYRISQKFTTKKLQTLWGYRYLFEFYRLHSW